jgi:hypothetical protein
VIFVRTLTTVGVVNVEVKTISLKGANTQNKRHHNAKNKQVRRGEYLSQPPWVVYIDKGWDGILAPSPGGYKYYI